MIIVQFYKVYPGLRVFKVRGTSKGQEGMVREVHGPLKTMTVVFDDSSVEEFAKPDEYEPASQKGAD